MKNHSLLIDISKILITSIITWSLTYLTFKKNYNATELARLNDNLNQLLQLDFDHPFLEDSTFISHWGKDLNSKEEKYLQYETYCIYVFNFLQNVCDYYDYDKEAIEKFVDIKELAIEHKSWLEASIKEDPSGYPRRFIDFIKLYKK